MAITAQHVNRLGSVAEWGTFADVLTTINTYVDVGEWTTFFLKTKHFVFVGATETLAVKILGSVDGGATYPLEVVSEFTVAAAATETKVDTGYYTHLKVQVKPNVNDTHGTLSTTFAGANF